MYRPVPVIQVHCWGEPVGAVALDTQSRFYAFQYAPNWLRSKYELSPLKLRKDTQPTRFPCCRSIRTIGYQRCWRTPCRIASATR